MIVLYNSKTRSCIFSRFDLPTNIIFQVHFTLQPGYIRDSCTLCNLGGEHHGQ